MKIKIFLILGFISLFFDSKSYAQSGCYVTAGANQLYDGIHPVSGSTYDCNYYILNCNGASPTSRYAVLGSDLGSCSFICSGVTITGRLRNYTVYLCSIDDYAVLFLTLLGSLGFFMLKNKSKKEPYSVLL